MKDYIRITETEDGEIWIRCENDKDHCEVRREREYPFEDETIFKGTFWKCVSLVDSLAVSKTHCTL